MKQIVLIFIMVVCVMNALIGQASNDLFQKVKGVVLDADSKKPIQGATITFIGNSKKTITDALGNFSLEKINLGRQSFEIQVTGYDTKLVNDVVVTSGKEVFLTVTMLEKVTVLSEVQVSARKNRTKANNEFATVSARSFSVEDTKRYPAAAFDPARMAQNFAGVSNNGDGTNEIVVRGNSPKGVLWRLEGIEIPNPNHFGNLGGSGGAISMLSSSTMGSSDFYTGAFPAEFGNATSGVFDLTFRNGNKDKNEFSFMAGLLGIEAAAEGPFKKGGSASYLVNYRYSTVALVKDFLTLGGVAPTYQDLSFKLHFPSKKGGGFSVFGLGGINKSEKDPVKDSTKWTDDDPNFVLEAPGKLGILGISYQYFLNKNAYIKTILSTTGQSAEATIDTLNPRDTYKKVPNGKEKDIDIAYRASIMYNNKLNSKNTLRLGIMVNRLSFDYFNSYYDDIDKVWKQSLAAKGSSMYYQAYIQWKYRINNRFTVNTGLHTSYLSLNKTKSIEPRAAITYQAGNNQTISFAMGVHAKPEQLSTYFFENISITGIRKTPNKNLAMNKALHFVLGYDKSFDNNIRFKVELYYQHLYNVAVEKKSGSYFSILNASSFYDLTDIGELTSTGKGKNYGIDLSLEKSFGKGYYFLTTGSLFQSKFTNYDNTEYNTRYNRNYQLNLVAGKEWKRKRNSNNTWGLNVKLLTSGGMRESEIDLPASRARGKVVYVPDNFYTQSNNPYLRLDAGISFKKNRKHSTHTFMLDFQNISDNKNIYYSYYDNKSGSVKKEYQLGLFPFLNYRIEF